MTRAAPCAALLVALLASPLPASADDAPQPRRFEFVNIADSSGPLESFGFSFPTINNSGTVVFSARVDTGVHRTFTGSGGPLTVIDGSALGFDETRGEFLAINHSGVVAAQGLRHGTAEVSIFTEEPDGTARVVATGFYHVVGHPENPPRQRYPVLETRRHDRPCRGSLL